MNLQAVEQLHTYHAFVKATLQRGGTIDEEATPEAFIEYQQQLAKVRSELAPAAKRFQEGKPAQTLDLDALANEVLGAM
jgi:hypothetical protein